MLSIMIYRPHVMESCDEAIVAVVQEALKLVSAPVYGTSSAEGWQLIVEIDTHRSAEDDEQTAKWIGEKIIARCGLPSGLLDRIRADKVGAAGYVYFNDVDMMLCDCVPQPVSDS